MNTCMECGALYARDECPVCWVRLAVRALYQRDAPLEPDGKREPEEMRTDAAGENADGQGAVSADGLRCPTCGGSLIAQTNAKVPDLYWCPDEMRLFLIEDGDKYAE